MTVEGALIADGVLSSCFSQIESHTVQKIAFDVIVAIYNAFGYLNSELLLFAVQLGYFTFSTEVVKLL